MTVVVGIRCTDGVVIGTDSAMTFGPSEQQLTIEQPYRSKIDIIDSHIIVAGTGQIGLGQRLASEVEKLWGENFFSDKSLGEIGVQIAKNTLDNFISTHVQTGQYGALVAVPCKKKAELIEFGLSTFQPEFKTAVTNGSASDADQDFPDALRTRKTLPPVAFARCFGVIPRRKGKMEYSQQRWCLNWLAICPRLALLLPCQMAVLAAESIRRQLGLHTYSLKMNCMKHAGECRGSVRVF